MNKQPEPKAPQVAVGAVVFFSGKVLLVRRNNPPQQGRWAIPGGSVELGETLQQAAEREIREETGLDIQAGEPVYTFDLIERFPGGGIRFHFVIVDLAAEYRGGILKPADDALEAGWFSPEQIDGLEVSDTTLGLLQKLGFL